MSQYAFIPEDKISEIHESYTITWSVEKDGLLYIGLEEVLFSVQQKAEISSLGGQWFESAVDFQNWMNNSNDPLLQVIRDRQFGQLILNEYLAQNRALELSLSDNLAQLNKFNVAKQLLETGTLTSVLSILEGIAIDVVFTQERKDYFVNKIQEHLNQQQ